MIFFRYFIHVVIVLAKQRILNNLLNASEKWLVLLVTDVVLVTVAVIYVDWNDVFK
jgi:hypothetical protein